jgi:5'-nucleotidase
MNAPLTISTSSRALFDLSESHEVFEQQGVDAYASYQIEHEDEPLQPGPAFHLVKKLLALNQSQPQPVVEIILLSRNSADTGLRIFNSIAHYGLDMTRAVFTSGRSPFDYVQAFHSHLFLSMDPLDVRRALNTGMASAMILPSKTQAVVQEQLRIAFDGDSVIFSDESEKIYQEQSLEAFNQHEIIAAKQPLLGGPFKDFLQRLADIQRLFPEESSPIRTALVTARSAPAHERVIRTLRAWNIRIDEALFLGGKEKGEFLKAFGADIFFDDHPKHCESASMHDVPSGHVISGARNR